MTRNEPSPELLPDAAECLRIRLLGGFEVTVGGRVVESSAWRLRKAAALLKLLALSERHQIHREQALELLWPETEPKAAANNLRGILHTIRHTLTSYGQCTWLRLHDDALTLGPADRVWVDVRAFESACVVARRTPDPAPYYETLRLYTGELLPSDRYEDWAVSRREQVRDMYLSLLLDLARLHEARQELQGAIEALQRVVEVERSHEEAHTGLMRLYALSGQRHQSLRQYGQLRDALRREFDVEPSAESEHLYRDIRTGLFLQKSSRFPVVPADHTVPAPRHNLPAPLTSFVGREREVVEVRRLLETTRLLSLIGTGGCGKTRLALEVARSGIPEYADGIWLVELAGLSDPRLVPRAVTGVLGVAEESERSPVDILSDALRSKRMLLVLDNCEHLLDACAHLAQALLSSCPRVRVLATSREALGVGGELHWRVPSLSVPPADILPRTDHLSEYGSVRLFVERARHRESTLDLSNTENIRAVAEICRQLDGLPLAIELATSRIPVLSVRQIAGRLHDALGLLTGGGRMAVPRHQTLRGVLDWSYALLSGPEQQLLARLSVFAGGWTLEAAESVGHSSTAVGSDTEDVLEVLSRLVDRSLVQVEMGRDGGIRYRLLESIRQYAHERLEESGEAEVLRHKHAQFFVALAEEAESELIGPRQGEWLARLEEEHDNIRGVLAWSLERGEVEVGARIAAVLWRFWWVHGHLSDGREWLRRVLAAGEVSARTRARVLRGAGMLERTQNEFRRAAEFVEQAVELFRELGDKEGLSNATGNLGSILTGLGEYERARQVHEEGLALGWELNDIRGIAVTLGDLALNYYEQGDYATAMSYWEESLPLYGESGDTHSLAITLSNLGALGYYLGELEHSPGRLEQAVALFRELDARATLSQSLQNLADVRVSQGRHEEAASILRESLTLAIELGSPETIAYCLETYAKLVAAQAQPERAATLLGAADGVRNSSGAALSPGSQKALQPTIDTVRASLTEDTWCLAQKAGRAMSVAQSIEYAFSAPQPKPTETLTSREREIAALIAEGLTNRQIAERLVLSARTVDAHTSNIIRKLGLRSRTEVAAWATARGGLPVQ